MSLCVTVDTLKGRRRLWHSMIYVRGVQSRPSIRSRSLLAVFTGSFFQQQYRLITRDAKHSSVRFDQAWLIEVEQVDDL